MHRPTPQRPEEAPASSVGPGQGAAKPPPEPIAICGHSIRLPGIQGAEEFVDMLRAKALCRSDVVKTGRFHASTVDEAPDNTDPWTLRSRWHNLFTQEEGEWAAAAMPCRVSGCGASATVLTALRLPCACMCCIHSGVLRLPLLQGHQQGGKEHAREPDRCAAGMAKDRHTPPHTTSPAPALCCECTRACLLTSFWCVSRASQAVWHALEDAGIPPQEIYRTRSVPLSAVSTRHQW
jgi:hypothetical protein